jgi:hypothetical protein
MKNKTKPVQRIETAVPELALMGKGLESEGKGQYTAAGGDSLRQASGCNPLELGHRSLFQALNGVRRGESIEDPLGQANEAGAFLASVGPAADAIEGALAAQLLGLHTAAMRCLTQFENTTDGQRVDIHLNRVTKLLRAFTAALEAFDRHRGRGGGL